MRNPCPRHPTARAVSSYGTTRTGPRPLANGRYCLEKADLGDPPPRPRHAAAWDARESGLWRPPTASRRATLSANRTKSLILLASLGTIREPMDKPVSRTFAPSCNCTLCRIYLGAIAPLGFWLNCEESPHGDGNGS